MKNNDILIEESSGNIFTDLGYVNAEEALLKSNLAQAIVEIIEQQKLSEIDVFTRLGINSLILSKLKRGQLRKLEIGELLNFLNLLNQDVEIIIRNRSKVKADMELADQAGIAYEHIMLERQKLAEDGVVTVAAAINHEGKLLAQPEVHLRGVVMAVERSVFHRLIVLNIDRFLVEFWKEFIVSSNGKITVDWERIQQELEKKLQRIVKRELQSSPSVIFLLQTETPSFSLSLPSPIPSVATNDSISPIAITVSSKTAKAELEI
jgi:predicted XRE-type DNA-binding protein